ncbi:alpha/beta hydrolase [Sinorhizobium sp. BG8]|uniref:serine aminopeptidase domain-containing protein n=1 Tax=Sinorhizobium sp. BG8 TaxID=2613773 RepID=UPI00193E7D8A|nr:alpha/beta hydrolase [Sinorhizobium sp. BG8]
MPVTFCGLTGLFEPARGRDGIRDLSVLFLSPWGLEEMCTRKFWRILAEDFSDLGVASLRFDYPATVNAIDPQEGVAGIASWLESVGKAIDTLKEYSGTSRVVLLGQGLGASLAMMISRRTDIDGLALLAPVLKGRSYLRELTFWSKVVDDALEIPESLREAGVAIAGVRMPEKIAADLRSLDLTAPASLPCDCVFVARRTASQNDSAFCEGLRERGRTVTAIDYEGYDELVSNPLTQKMPSTVPSELSTWLRSLTGFSRTVAGPPRTLPAPAALAGHGFQEVPVRFGTGDRLYGTLCRPKALPASAAVLILTTAYDHQAGWGRSSVELARMLAENGIASLRFDAAGAGDSPPVAGRREQILYDEWQMDDVAAARDLLQMSTDGAPALILGRCSGAYLAYNCAVADPNWAGCVVINPFTFRWRTPPSEDALLHVPRPLKDYSQKAMRMETVRRLLAGQVDVRTALTNILKRVFQRLTTALAPVLGPLLPLERWNRAVHRDFRSLRDRAAPIALFYSDNDGGLENFRFHFGENGERLKAYPNAELHMLAGADHNLTPLRFRRDVQETVVRLTRSLAQQAARAETAGSGTIGTVAPEAGPVRAPRKTTAVN